MPVSYKMISDKHALLDWRARAAAQPHSRVVLGLEADRFSRSPEKVCLI